MPATPEAGTGSDTCLGFDFGEKRIGIAVGQSTTRTASPLATVRNHNGRPDWQRIDELVKQWRPSSLIVGEPVDTDEPLMILVKAFARRLTNRYQLPVHLVDERYSSIEASRVLAHNRRHASRRVSKRDDLDKMAAAIILELWLSDAPHEN